MKKLIDWLKAPFYSLDNPDELDYKFMLIMLLIILLMFLIVIGMVNL